MSVFFSFCHNYSNMSYRKDPDLEFLSTADNEDLLLLADTLLYKDAQDKKDKLTRWAATLDQDDLFDYCYPHHMRSLWQPIAEELQKFGGHSVANWLLRGNQGVLYREILADVCERQNVNVDLINSTTAEIENAFLEKIVELAIENMSDAERRELVQGLRNVKGFGDQLKENIISKKTLLTVVKLAFKQGGFNSYILTLQVVNGISKAVIGRGLSFAANHTLMKCIGSYMSGPLGLAISIVTTAWGAMGPNKDVCLKSVAIVAYMRKKKEMESQKPKSLFSRLRSFFKGS